MSNPHHHLESYRSSRLPPVLARDYRRNVIWPIAKLYISIAFLAAIILGLIP